MTSSPRAASTHDATLSADNAVTVCTVSFHNAPHLELNWRLSDTLNHRGGHLRWVVAENTPSGSSDRLAMDDPHFTVIEGVGREHVPNFQHTLALHKCFQHVATRFLLVLDPDFYVVRPDWVNVVTRHMLQNGLTFFGVPWHPRFSDKYRYFPAVHCFFVDLALIDLGELDFRPTSPDSRAAAAGTRPGPLARWLGLAARRKDLMDTGTRMYHRFAGSGTVRYECALPVFRLPQDAPISTSWRSRLVEHFLPDDLCYLPKRRDSYAATGLRELGYLDEAPAYWEEFMWQGKPFGFHVRRNARKGERDAAGELDILARAIRGIVAGPPDGQRAQWPVSPGGGSRHRE